MSFYLYFSVLRIHRGIKIIISLPLWMISLQIIFYKYGYKYYAVRQSPAIKLCERQAIIYKWNSDSGPGLNQN